MKKFGIGILAGLVLSAGVGVFTASKSDNDVLREAKDRAEIEDLMWRYTRALDTSDGEAYAATYTTDGQFGAGANATKGRDALKRLAGGGQGQRAATAPATPRPAMYHMTANERITFSDKDHARVEAYYLTAMAAAGDTPLRVAAVGRSIDDVVRVNGQWLIKSRDVSPKD
jgi:3-phenylpropionate/cinnamic acid dioxygenase small subunit